MKKHQLAAMVLSALSAGIIISCSKPKDETLETAENQKVESNTNIDSQALTNNSNSNDSNDDSSDATSQATSIEAIELPPEAAQSYLKQVADNHILKAYNDVVEQSQMLNELAIKHCQPNKAVNSNTLAILRKQWLAMAKSWAYAEIINFGPAMDSMSNLYINYYPDERGLVHQGVIDLIGANPNLTADELASESAIVQGIPGIEEVLYANESLTPEQCHYIVSASSALANRLGNVQQAWQGSPEQLLGIDDSDSKLGLNRWINSILALVEITKSTSLDQPLGLTGNKKGHLPADAAGQSREIINAKVSALNDALTDPALIAILSEHGHETLANKMSTILSEMSTLLAEMPEDIAKAQPAKQKELYDKMTELTQVVKRQLMPTFGVQVGFNSTDGD